MLGEVTHPQRIRIQKLLAEAGVASRRSVEDMMRRGEVLCNGITVGPGAKADPRQDEIVVQGKKIHFPAASSENEITLLLHKPKGWLCSHRDPHHSQLIYDLIPENYRKRRLICAGRLDYDSEGLVLLTSDGTLAHSLMHPSGRIPKVYSVRLDSAFPQEKLPLLLEGVKSEDGLLRVDLAAFAGMGAGHEKDSKHLEVTLHHGKKREIRRLFAALGYRVCRLVRVRIGPFSLQGLSPGEVRLVSTSRLQALIQ